MMILVLGSGAPNTVKGYDPNELLDDSLMNMESNYSNDETPNSIFNEVQQLLGTGQEEQAIIDAEAKAKEQSRYNQTALDFYNKSLEYETACPNGGNYTLEDFKSSIYGIDKACVDLTKR